MLVALFVCGATDGAGQTRQLLPFFPAAADSRYQGFARVINREARSAELTVVAVDDSGRRTAPMTLPVPAHSARHFNSNDLERGNADKGFAPGVGPPRQGNWRLETASASDLEVLAFIRTKQDGLLASMHDLAPMADGTLQIAFFNPGRNNRQVSRLRLINPGDTALSVTIRGIDDSGAASGETRVTLPPRAARGYTAAELETGGDAIDGALGEGRGKWRLALSAPAAMHAMSLLTNPTGHIANLSTTLSPVLVRHDAETGSTARHVPFFPAASRPSQGFLRIVNRGPRSALWITAYDELGEARAPVALTLEANQATHLNSTDLERGNSAKGLTEGIGVGTQDWRLLLRTTGNMDVLAYLRSAEGFVTSMHDVAPLGSAGRHLAFFNPGANTRQESRLRLVNLGGAPATVNISALDDNGQAGAEATTSVPAKGARTLTASALETGDDGLGVGEGKWRLTVRSNQPLAAMSLLRAPSGHTINLSTTTRTPPSDPPDSASERVELVDSIPSANADIDPRRHVNIAHAAPADTRYSYSGACPTAVAVRRRLPIEAALPAQEVVDHKLECALAPDRNYRLRVDGRRPGNGRLHAELPLSTNGRLTDSAIVVRDSRRIDVETVNQLFQLYVWEALLAEFESDSASAALLALTIDQIARNAWRELRKPRASLPVVARRVSYLSRDGRGERSANATGLVAMPDLDAADDFSRKDRVIVLSHATGSTPSALELSDAWFAVAGMLAGRGYLVIVPDNWGRGELAADDQPETYLLANRTANSSIDLIRAVLASDDYRRFHNPRAEETDLAIIGYSQGGHAAVALWLALHTGDHGVRVRELHSGGGPHNLAAIFRGIMQNLDGTCDGNVWCRHAERNVFLPYLTGRLLPALFAYADTGLTRDDVVEDGDLLPEFLTGFLRGDAKYQRLWTTLALNSLTNVVAPETVARAGTAINLYHSTLDRLVPEANTRQLAELLAPRFNVTYHEGECDSDGYLFLSEVISLTGVLHTVCGIEVLDEMLKRYK